MKKYTRAEVTTEFMDAVVEIGKARIAAFAQQVRYASDRQAQFLRGQKGPVVAKLARLKTQAGRDFELTRLRGLGYTRFAITHYGGTSFLTAHTADISIVLWSGSGKPRDSAPRWNMGPYTIYLRKADLMQGQVGQAHFVPDRDPYTQYRHPHHKAYDYAGNASHPTEQSSSTCWGSFGAIVSDCAQNGDMVELYRSLHAYLSRYNSRSPLGGGIEYCDFAIGDANARAVYG